MNKVMKAANQAKLPVKARIGIRKPIVKGRGPLPKNARNRGPQGKPSQFKKLVKITRTIERGSGGVKIKSRTFIAKGGTILRIKKNVPLNNEKKILSRLGRKNLQTKNIKNITTNKQVQNLNPLIRKVEFDDGKGLEVETVEIQNDFIEDVNYDFKDMLTFSKSALLPTPPVQQLMFPPVQEFLHNKPQSLMSKIVDNFREHNFSRDNYDISRDNYDISRDKYDISRDNYDISRDNYDISRDHYDISRDNYDMSYPYQRGSYREDEIISNQYRNYGNQNEIDYQILSRDYRPFKNYEQNYEYQRTNNNYSSYQKPYDYDPYYDNMYDQRRINRTYTENSGRFGPFGNQGTWREPSFYSRYEENRFGGVGYPYRNRSQTYGGPRRFERNYRTNNGLVGYASNNSVQQEKSAESIYSYRPGDKKKDTSKIGISVTMGNSSSAKIGQNSDRSSGDSKFYGKVVQNNMGSKPNANSGPSNNAVNKDISDPKGYLNGLIRKKGNFERNLKTLPPSRSVKKQNILKKLQETNEEIARLENQYGEVFLDNLKKKRAKIQRTLKSFPPSNIIMKEKVMKKLEEVNEEIARLEK